MASVESRRPRSSRIRVGPSKRRHAPARVTTKRLDEPSGAAAPRFSLGASAVGSRATAQAPLGPSGHAPHGAHSLAHRGLAAHEAAPLQLPPVAEPADLVVFVAPAAAEPRSRTPLVVRGRGPPSIG
jgi:hypothetical protein